MHEPPSHELVRQLTELQLCKPNDLRRARGRVRRLSFDLPAFDSVWIDSLVQLRLLTPYQAQQIEQGHADDLRIGSFVAVDELGRSHRGATLLARRLHRRDFCVVKRLRLPADRADDVNEQMQMAMDRANGFVHPHLVQPHEILTTGQDELVTISRYVPGLPLNELLVRRGRFPAAVVFEIGRQLFEGLAALHSRSLVHGDIRMSNVRLTDTGLAVLVDGGWRQIVHPEITIHDTLALEAYDGLAPELIGTGAPVSASSEMYAVGCLLWQLLAGRSPFTTADPLAKLAAHQTLRIDDVRLWAPDTPDLLAQTIRQLTAPSPLERPRSFDEVLQRWGRPGSFSRSRLKQFRRLFDGAVPHLAGSRRDDGLGTGIWFFAALFAVMGAVAIFHDGGLRNELLQVVHDVKRSVSKASVESNALPSNEAADVLQASKLNSTVSAQGLLPLPAPGADGVILLVEPGPYAAGRVNFPGALTIRGTASVASEIQVGDVPLTLSAQSISLEGISVRQQPDTVPLMLIKLRSQQLNVSHCEFRTASASAADLNEASPLDGGIPTLGWMPTDVHGMSQVTVENSIFQGEGTAILLGQPSQTTRIWNTLKTARGSLVALDPKSSAGRMDLELDSVTLRGTGPLLRLTGELAVKTGSQIVAIATTNCVFQLAEVQSGLIVLDTERPRADAAKSVEFSSNNSVAATNTAILTRFDASRDRFHEIEMETQFDGLAFNEIFFSGVNLSRPSHSKTGRLQGPRQAQDLELPGIDPRHIGPTNRAADVDQ